jgi:altronate dehydratase small subunit
MDSVQALRLSSKDNVANVLADVPPGAEVVLRPDQNDARIKALERIPFGFKIAVTDITKGSSVIKYGESIGIASRDIRPGQLVHIHNVEGARGRGDLAAGNAP